VEETSCLVSLDTAGSDVERQKSRVKRRRDQFADVEDIGAGSSGYTAGRIALRQERDFMWQSTDAAAVQPPPVPESLLSTPEPLNWPCPGMMSFTSVNSTL